MMVKTLGFEATDAEKTLTLHTISSKTEIIQCISDEMASHDIAEQRVPVVQSFLFI